MPFPPCFVFVLKVFCFVPVYVPPHGMEVAAVRGSPSPPFAGDRCRRPQLTQAAVRRGSMPSAAHANPPFVGDRCRSSQLTLVCCSWEFDAAICGSLSPPFAEDRRRCPQLTQHAVRRGSTPASAAHPNPLFAGNLPQSAANSWMPDSWIKSQLKNF